MAADMNVAFARISLGSVLCTSLACGEVDSSDRQRDARTGAGSQGGAGDTSVGGVSGGPSGSQGGAIAAGGRAGDTGVAGVAGGASESQGGATAAGGGGAASAGFTGCDNGDGSAPASVGFASGTTTPFEGNVNAVTADSLLIGTANGQETFAWRGPALDEHFAVGDAVSVSFPPAGGGLAPSHWAIVASGKKRAATLAANIWVMAGTTKGHRYDLPSPGVGFPRIELINQGCCGDPSRPAWCDYSLVQLTAGDQTASGSQPVVLGAWTVTLLEGTYTQTVEYVMNVRMSVLGRVD